MIAHIPEQQTRAARSIVRRFCGALLAGSALVMPATAMAQASTVIWDGDEDTDWGNPDNWSDGFVPQGNIVVVKRTDVTPVISDDQDYVIAGLVIGEGSDGIVTVTSGGRLRLQQVATQGPPIITIGQTTNIFGVINPAKGQLFIDGGAVTTTGVLNIGASFRSTGELVITNGGLIEVGSFCIGCGNTNFAGNGLVIIDGAGSTFRATLVNGQRALGNNSQGGGTGDIIIRNGGRFELSTPSTFGMGIGRGSSLLVTGAGSTFDLPAPLASSGSIIVANGGNAQIGNLEQAVGNLSITTGGTVDFTGIQTNVFGEQARVLISGEGTVVNSAGNLSIGSNSSGAQDFVITDNAVVNVTSTVQSGLAFGGERRLAVRNGAVLNMAGGLGMNRGILEVSDATVNLGSSQLTMGTFFGNNRLDLFNADFTAGTIGTSNGSVINLGGTADGPAGAAGAFNVGLVSLFNTQFVINHTESDYRITSQFTGSTADANAAVIRHVAGDTIFETGASGQYQGRTLITGGSLRINSIFGAQTHRLTVSGGGTLGGTGRINGTVTIEDGTLSPGEGTGNLTFGNSLVLTEDSVLNFELGAPGSVAGVNSDLVTVLGNLTLDGTLNVSDIGGFGAGLYRLIDYSGTLTDNGLAIGSAPVGFAPQDLGIVTATTRQVNLLVNSASGSFNFWDGSDINGNGVIDGGSGIWTATSENWTQTDGARNGAYDLDTVLIFAGAPGTVTVDNAAGAVVLGNDVQFATSGYTLGGDDLTLGDGPIVLRVGDGSAAGAAISATIATHLIGGASIEKTDLGTLILTGSAAPAAGTTISQGTMQIGAGGDSGAVAGNIVNHGALAFNRADAAVYAGNVSGVGTLEQRGPGTLTLSGTHSYSGLTTVAAGTLVNSGTIAGATSVLADASLINQGLLNGTLTNEGNALIGGIVNAAIDHRAGTLEVTGEVTGDVLVSTGSLSGTGRVGGAVTLQGGSLSPGANGEVGTLSMGALVLGTNSVLNFQLGAPDRSAGDGSDFITIGGANASGDLTLDGKLNVTDVGGFGPGLYRLIDYSGSLSDLGLDIGMTPDGMAASDLIVVTAVAGQISLMVDPGVGSFNFWDGEGDQRDNRIEGGSGTWNATSRNWTSADGSRNGIYEPSQQLIFAGTGGTVTVDNSLGEVFLGGGPAEGGSIQFAGNGYRITGDPLRFDANLAIINVGDGTSAGAAIVATMDSALTGLGTLSKRDRGTLVLNGSNSFRTVEILGGTIRVGNNNALGRGLLTSVNGTLQIADGAAITLNNFISTTGRTRIDTGSAGSILTLDGGIQSFGSGVISQIGSGTLVLNGNNTFAGGLTVDTGGTVQIGSSTSAGTGAIDLTGSGSTLRSGAPAITLANAINVASTGRIIVGSGETMTLNGVITGAGSLDKLADGTLVLNGVSSFDGLNVGAGIVQLGNSSAAGRGNIILGRGTTLRSGGADITLSGFIGSPFDATIDVRTDEVLTLTGGISGSGIFRKAGSGTLVLGGTGANSITRLHIMDGTVVGPADHFRNQLIQNDGALFIDQRTDDMLRSSISGNGALIKSGQAALTIAALNADFTGATTINQGRLVVTGSLARSAVTVKAGAVLGGNGRVGEVTVERGGRVAPGLSPGTLTIDGNFNLEAGAVYEAELSASGHDLIVVNGAANIAGDLELIPLDTFTTFNTELTLLSATSRTGGFANVIGLDRFGAAFAPVLLDNGTTLTLRLAPASLGAQLGDVLDGNAFEVAAALDRSVVAGYNPQGLFALFNRGPDLSAALSQLSGELHSAGRRVLLQDSLGVREAALDRIGAGGAVFGTDTVRRDDGQTALTAWSRVSETSSIADADGKGSSFTSHKTAVIAGFDLATKGFLLGAMFHHSESDLELTGSGTAQLTSTGGAVYAGWREDNGPALGVGGSIAGHTALSTRTVRFPGLDQTLNGRAEGTTYQLFGEASYDLATADDVGITPFVRLAYTRVASGTLEEIGGSAALSAPSQAVALTQTSAGLRGSYRTKTVALSGFASWQRSSGARDAATDFGFTNASAAARIVSTALDRDMLALDLQGRIALTSHVTLGAGYSGLIGQNNEEHGARATLTIDF